MQPKAGPKSVAILFQHMLGLQLQANITKPEMK